VQVTLPSGATVELRDKVTAKDKFAVQKSLHFSLDTQTLLQESSGGLVTDMTNALLAQLITSWSFTLPVPSVSIDSLAELDLDDYDALAEAVDPILQKVMGPGPNRTGRSSS
jgi:hypothetical protein